jgi:CRP/FNR family transcriptional regulator, anaerobic regulatory protein
MEYLDSLKYIFEAGLIEEMEDCGELMKFKEGDVIMDYGKYIKMMPIVVAGSIKVMKLDDGERELLLYYLSASDSCSMAYNCCMEMKKSEVKAVAEEDTVILAIPHNKLDSWLCKYPSWKNYIMRSFNERFLELLESVENIAFRKLDERLVRYLKEKSELTGSSLVKASHSQIAEDLASARVVISRLLKHLENDGKILLYRNEIKLLKKFFEDN